MKKIWIILCTLFTITIMSGCATDEQIAELEAVEEQAKINAADYVEEKYGFKPMIFEVEGETGDDTLFPNYEPTGYAYVTCMYHGIDFQVYITGEEASTEGIDNYQKDVILEAVQKAAADTFVFDTDNIYIDVERRGLDMVGAYYDGTNLLEILNSPKYSWNYTVFVTDVDLPNIDTTSILDNLGQNAKIEIINCYNAEDLSTVKTQYLADDAGEIGHYGIYVKDYLTFSQNSNEYMDFKVVEHDALTVVMIEGTYCDIAETSVDPMEWKGYGYTNPKQIFGAYAIETDAKRIFIFVNTDTIDTNDPFSATMALKYKKDGEQCYYNGTLIEHIEPCYLSHGFWSNHYTDIIVTMLEDQ